MGSSSVGRVRERVGVVSMGVRYSNIYRAMACGRVGYMASVSVAGAAGGQRIQRPEHG
mgnify:CR=1 FL=1